MHPTFASLAPSSPNPFSLREKGNRNFKVPLPEEERFRARATQLGCTQNTSLYCHQRKTAPLERLAGVAT